MADRHLQRHFPVRPNLEQLKHQAKDLLRAIKQGEPSALAELKKHHPKAISQKTQSLPMRSLYSPAVTDCRVGRDGHRLPDDRCDLARRC